MRRTRRRFLLAFFAPAWCAGCLVVSCTQFGEAPAAVEAGGPANDAPSGDAPVPDATPGDAPSDAGGDRFDAPSPIPCNPGDPGCVRYVFVTSGTFNGNFGGVVGADARCKAVAAATGTLEIKARAPRFIAWLSDNNGAESRLANDARRYVGADNAVVAFSKGDLVDGQISGYFNRTEASNPVAGVSVWTGTISTGAPHGLRCADWKSDNANDQGRLGDPDVMDNGDWTSYSEANCNELNHLYCIEM